MILAPPPETKPNFHYVRLANELESKILEGIYQVGEKLPSIRDLHNRMGLSISTIYQSYIELEKRELIEARPKSGYYVKAPLHPILPSPNAIMQVSKPKKVDMESMVQNIVSSMCDPSLIQMGCAVLNPELLPLKQFSRNLQALSRQKMESIMSVYGSPSGDPSLRRQLAKRAFGNPDGYQADDIIVTSGGMEAVHLCLQAVAKPGDTIAVESPSFFNILHLLEASGMYALEIPTSPEDGPDLDALENALKRQEIKAYICISNFQNPLGFVIPDEKKKKMVDLFARHNVPLIEDNIYGDLYFDENRPSTLKSFDTYGIVMLCSSFSKTLAAGLRVGWTMPGRFKDKVLKLKIAFTIASPILNQQLIAEFLQSGSYDRHLRKLRTALKSQMRHTSLAIARNFPQGTKMTSPNGGFILWVELDPSIDSIAVYNEAREQGIVTIPGPICSSSHKFRNYMRLSCGNPWTEEFQQVYVTLGEILHRHLKR